MANIATMRPKKRYHKCCNCGNATTKQLRELETPIKGKTVLPIYAVCTLCFKAMKDERKETDEHNSKSI